MGIDIGGLDAGLTTGAATTLSGLIADLPTILFWTMTLLGVTVIGVAYYFGKKYHYAPFVKYKFDVLHFSPRGGEWVPTFHDKFAVVHEGDNQYLLTQKERLVMPYNYLKHLRGNYLFINARNRLEVFPFKPRTLKMKEEDEEKLSTSKFIGENDYIEVLNDGPREIFLGRLQKSKDKYKKENFFTQIAPYGGWAVVVLFSFLLITALAEQLTTQFQISASIAQTNAQAVEHMNELIDKVESTSTATSTPRPPSDAPDKPF